MPLAISVQSLIPSGHIVVYPPDASITALVEKGDSSLPWLDQVRIMAVQANLDVRVDGNTLFFEQRKAAAVETVSASGPATLPEETAPLTVVEDAASPAQAPVVVTAPEVQVVKAAEESVPVKEAEKAAENEEEAVSVSVAPEPEAEQPAVRLAEGVLMGTPTQDPPRRGQSAPKPPESPASVPVPAPEPAAAPAPAPVVQATSEVPAAPVVQAPETVALSQAVNEIRPSGTRVVYASNVDRAAQVVLPAKGEDWRKRMNELAVASSLRVEEVNGTLFVNPASQAVSLDEGYPQPGQVQVSASSKPEPAETPEAEEAPVSLAAAPEVQPVPAKQDAAVVVASAAEPVADTPVPEKPVSAVAEPVVSLAPVAEEAAPSAGSAVPAEEQPVEVRQAVAQAESVEPDMTAAVGSNFDPDEGRPFPSGGLWRAERGSSLHDVLSDWCQRAGVQLVWSSRFDFPLQVSISLDDSFEGAVRTLLSGFVTASPQPVGRLHRQANFGSRVLIIETRGNRYGETQ